MGIMYMCLIVAKRRLAHGRGGASEERTSDGLTSLKAFKGTKKALTTPVTSLSLRSSSAVARSSLRSERQLIDHSQSINKIMTRTKE